MSKKTPIKVHVWPTKHKGNDIWKVAIDDVGGGTKTSHGYECVIKGKVYPIIRVNKN